MSSAPIGVFDSGLGGLTVLAALRARLPREDFIYFADTRFLPYGDRPETFIQARGEAIARALVERGAKALVVACNTATAVAGEGIRACVIQPVVALEPAVKPAVSMTRSGVIGVLATTRTLASQRFQRLVHTHGNGVQIIPQACPGLAEAIETLGPDSSQVELLLDKYVQPLALAGADVVVLGCTHYPWVRDGIARRLPPGSHIVDTGEAVARQVERRLSELGCLVDVAGAASEAGGVGRLSMATSGDPVLVQEMVARLWPDVLPVEHWDIEVEPGLEQL
ncbi:MAG: glutamate racemase [Azovibrio sp.]